MPEGSTLSHPVARLTDAERTAETGPLTVPRAMVSSDPFASISRSAIQNGR